MGGFRAFLLDERGSVLEDWPMILLVIGLFFTVAVSMGTSGGAQWSDHRATINIGLGSLADRLPQIGPLHH